MKRKIACMFLTVLLLLSCISAAYAGSNEGNYIFTRWRGSTEMGVYEPGTYVISSSSFSEAQKNIMDGLNVVCRTRIGRFLSFGGCNYVAAANVFVRFVPGASYYVSLYDADSGSLVWAGNLQSGKDDLYLGTDHRAYRVVFTSKNGMYFTGLFRK